MLKLSDIRLTGRSGESGLRQIASDVLGVPASVIDELHIQKLSIDARRKPDVRFVYTLLVSLGDERMVLDRNPPNVSIYAPPERYAFPQLAGTGPNKPTVIVGTGPAGLFASLCLAEAGVRCIILERGQPVERRIGDVERFWCGKGLDTSSNVQFGEGGAGTFSDGKLTTGVNDKRIRFVLEQFVRFGAPDDILYLSKPHIGTDRLRGVVRAIRNRLIELGCDIRFGHRLADIEISEGALHAITVETDGGSYSMESDTLILAPGNSARDTFEMLRQRGITLTAKDFSVGVRIEHLQRDIDTAQYGAETPLCADLPASDYKLVVHLQPGAAEGGAIKRGRSVYSFCVCPGGQVVAAASESGGVVSNGMSLYARDGENISGALLVGVTADDFGHGALDGVEFQRRLEREAYKAGGGDYRAPAQLVGDFLEKRASTGCKRITPTYLPGVRFCNLWDVLPEFVCEALRAALLDFAGRITGFADPDAVMTAVESRSSCPVRIVREEHETVGVRGIFPCGEGSGYAGGIISAAIDGIKAAEAACIKMAKMSAE